MRICALFAIALAFAAQSEAAAAQEQRPRLASVSAIRVANYGAPSALIESRGQVNAIVEELNGLRSRPWRRGETQLSCYSHVILTSGKRTVATLRVTAEHVVERPVEKGQPSYSLEIRPADLPGLRKLLAEIEPAKDCK